MRIRFILSSAIIVLGLAFCAQGLMADEARKPSEEEMMAMMAKYGTPGEHHKFLEPMVGNWDIVTRWWMDPGAPVNESKATSECKWILGGRFMQEDVAGNMSGMPFHGMALTGYDNYKQKYISLWADEMSTSLLIGEGAIDATGKVITVGGSYDDYMTGKTIKYKNIIRIIDNSKRVMEMYNIGDDGREFKSMEITYTRKK